ENSANVTVVTPSPGGGTSNVQTFMIADAPLNANVSSISGVEGAAFSGQLAVFTDTNPKAPLTDFTTKTGKVSIDWGDNSTSLGTVTQPGGQGNPFMVSAGHTYTEDGSYTIKVTVTDLGGSQTTATGMAIIADAGLMASANAINAIRDISFSGTVAT